MGTNIENVDFKEIFQEIAIHVHNQAVQMRKDYDIPDGMIKLYADYLVCGTPNDEYYAFHYVVHVDNQSERFFIVTWTPATQDEFLDSIYFEKKEEE